MHHRRADAQVRQLLEDFRGIALRAAAPALLPGAVPEELRLGEDLEGRSLEPQSRHRGRHGDPEVQGTGDEAREIVEYLRLHIAPSQQVEQ